MSSALLQIIALGTMAVDHVGYLLFPQLEILRMIGRLSFPLFVFLLCEGFAHTRSRWKYLGRLALFAVISEIPYMLFAKGPYFLLHVLASPRDNLFSNVFFELMLVFIAVWGVKLGLEKNKLFFALPVLAAALGWLLGTMYGVYGILMGVCFYIFRKDKLLASACLGALTILYCFQHWSLFQIWAALAAAPIWFYNGERGKRLPKYFGYIFYPAHLLVIYGVFNLMP